MIYVLAFFLPFVGLLVKGLWIQGFFNFWLWVCGVVTYGATTTFAIIWAWVSIAQKVNKERHLQILDAIKQKLNDEKFERLSDKSSKIDEYFNAIMARSENTLDKEKRQSVRSKK